MGFATGLEVDYLPAAGHEPAQWEGVLGVATFGGITTPAPDFGAADLPAADIQMPVLDRGTGVREIWRAPLPLVSGQRGRVRYRCGDRTLFGCITLPEPHDIADSRGAEPVNASHGASPSNVTHDAGRSNVSDSAGDRSDGGKSPLHRATSQAYREILAAIDAAGYPYLVRIWNYLGEINRETHGLERYRQFNRARREALAGSGRDLIGNVPAASALGSASGSPLVVYFFASRNAPALIENPRQISAYDYPPEYGPRPTFSRASLLQEDASARVFISGTASIVGHETLHADDPAAQTEESLTNIESVLREANRLYRGSRFELEGLAYKVYVRNREDLPTIQFQLRRALGPQTRVTYLRADICRHDLLVEIEATGDTRGAPPRA